MRANGLSRAVSVTMVGYGGPLSRFVAEQVEAALAAVGRGIVVLGPGETGSGLVREITGVQAAMCAWLFGQQAAETGAAGVVAAVNGEEV
jgi:predicted site-specific integrase-resolvase